MKSVLSLYQINHFYIKFISAFPSVLDRNLHKYVCNMRLEILCVEFYLACIIFVTHIIKENFEIFMIAHFWPYIKSDLLVNATLFENPTLKHQKYSQLW